MILMELQTVQQMQCTLNHKKLKSKKEEKKRIKL